MDTDNRDFKGVWIPRMVWLDTRLSALDKIILTEIDSLDQGERGCYASNQHLAEFCQCSERKVSETVSRLVEYGYVYVQSFDGRKRTLRSSLATIANQPSKNCESATQNLRESNTCTNLLSYTKRKEKSATRFTPPTVEEVRAYCQERNNGIDPESFVDFYASKGWKVGREPMKDWRASVRTWERRDGRSKPKAAQRVCANNDGEQWPEF